MKLATYVKRPIEVKDYDIDYSAWLARMGDSISSVEGSVCDAPDAALKVDSVQFTATLVKVWISGGTDGADYEVEVTVTTAGGRTDQSELGFRIRRS